ncbi:MAG: hypothetical protein ABSB33_06370 [Tepidisphaeraceae bacterium]|jgi:hypothetical protein
MARPSKPKSQRRTNILRIRLTLAERKALDVAADAEHDETSSWARRVLLLRADQKA